MSRFFSRKYSNLTPYVPGEQPKGREYIKLNTNESPFPPSKIAQNEAKRQLDRLMLYSDPDQKELSKALAKTLGVNANQVIMTNGSDEVLNFAFMAYCDEQTPAVFPQISYGFYKVFAQVNCLPYKEIPLKSDFSIDPDDYIKEKGTVFIANPNAPTGIALSLEDIERIVSSDLNRMVVIDEAYIDFGGESAISLIGKYDNLIVTQTFSKSRSMAGARLGFGVSNEKVIQDLNTLKFSTNPYNVNKITASAGIGALKDVKYFENNCREIIKNREYVTKELTRLGFSLTDSKTNFVFVKHTKISGENLYLALKENGILVRHFSTPTIAEYNRITIGSYKQMQILIKTIEKILEENR